MIVDDSLGLATPNSQHNLAAYDEKYTEVMKELGFTTKPPSLSPYKAYRQATVCEVLGYVFPEEEYSYWLMNLLMWVLPTTVAIAAAVDALLGFVYMKYAHPWRGILADPAPQEVIPDDVQSSSRKKLKIEML